MAVIKKSYKPRKFAGLLRSLHSPHHRGELEKLFADEDGRRNLRSDLTKSEKKFLKEAGKIVRANRGILRMGMLIVIGLPLAGLVVFGLFFMNPLLGRLLEGGMEGIFAADADVVGFRLNPLQPGIHIDSLAQGDGDHPMKKLFEVQDLNLRLSMDALLHGSLVIDDMQAENISWGGDRETSAVLTDSPGADADSGNGGGDVPGSDGGSRGFALPELSLNPDSAMAALRASAVSPALIENLKTDAGSAAEDWKSSAAEITSEVSGFRADNADLLSLNVSFINDIASLQNLITRLGTASNAAGELKTSISGKSASARDRYQNLEQQYRDARAAVSEDLVGAAAQIEAAAAGGLDGALGDYLRGLLVDNIGDKAILVLKGWSFYQRFRSEGNAPVEEKRSARRTGVDVDFGLPKYPRFLIRNASFSFVSNDGLTQSLKIRNLSSQPELLAQPAFIGYSGIIGVPIEVEVDIDAREYPASTDIHAAASSVSLAFGDHPDFVPLKSLSGNADITVDIGLTEDDPGRFFASVQLTDPVASADGAVGVEVAAALASADELNAGLTAGLDAAGGLTDIRFTSNVPGIISGLITDIAVRQREQFAEDMKVRIDEYRDDLDGRLAEAFGPASDAYNGLTRAVASGDSVQEELDALQTMGKDRLAELIREQAGSSQGDLLDDAKDAVKNLPGLSF